MSARLKRILVYLASIGGGVYIILSIYLYFYQTDFIFLPQRTIISTPKDYKCSFSDVRIPLAEGGGTLHGWWLPHHTEAAPFVSRTLIYMHGNGANVGENSEHTCRLNRMGFAVLIFDYRGYGQSDAPPKGKINEESVYADAEAAWNFVTSGMEAKARPADVVLYGHSLGGAIATEMATRHPDANALIVESTFTSMADMANKDAVFGFFPIRLILDQKMESEEKLRRIHMPVLVIHGGADSIVPATMSQRLYNAAASPHKRLFVVQRADHGNVADMAGSDYARTFREFFGNH
ncbi:MAG TPA: alpha/beta hydrolase [Terriglobales bacterium]|nr:alpha/beta hydrolase [Terriglobales bacterium]